MTASSPTRDALFEQGCATFDSSLAISAQQFVTHVEALAPGFGRLIVEMEFGDIYSRPGLDLKTRELVIIASCAALGSTGFGAVKMHVPAALRHGATRAEIVESLVQVAMAAGLPTSLGALQAAKEAFDELDAAQAAQ
ncbi:MAG: carboxymuconolactone decarboxylase family protein [Pseudomonas sp.]|uniref:carboxymuconolactone decarboxylase family protein n=1 Tax=Pseudomonas abieticivorans TaxID=2931382 RepID=UPI0020BE0446|nr:carboxymuconolactone decarboxylase family protein [Pseudomonas sp. PIA16]MDE1164453.1 carboxymuconolactone decarboxylase family protein [Pseudomonas sp.]